MKYGPVVKILNVHQTTNKHLIGLAGYAVSKPYEGIGCEKMVDVRIPKLDNRTIPVDVKHLQYTNVVNIFGNKIQKEKDEGVKGLIKKLFGD